MLKDLLSESAKQFEAQKPVHKPDTEDQCICWELGLFSKAFLSSRISSAFALGEQSGIKKAEIEIKKLEKVMTPHGEANVVREEDVYGSYDKRISVVFPDGRKSQYSSASLKIAPSDKE